MTPQQRQKRAAKRRRELSGELSLQCEIAADATLPRLRILANTGQPMLTDLFGEPVVVDLAGVEFAGDRIPILAEHDSRKRIGHTVSHRVAGGRIEASAVVSGSDAAAADLVAELRRGFPFQASIGGPILETERLKKGQTAVVNGRRVEGPLIIARRMQVKEISILVFGADPATQVELAAAAAAKQKKDSQSMTEFEQWLQASGFDHGKLTDEQREFLKAQHAELSASRSLDLEARQRLTERAGQAAENEDRIEQVTALFSRPEYAELRSVRVDGKNLKLAEFRRAALTETDAEGRFKWGPANVENVLLKSARELPTSFNVHVRDSLENVQNPVLTCAMLRASGIPDSMTVHRGTDYAKKTGLETMFPAEILERSRDPKIQQYTTLQGLMGLTCAIAGRPYHGDRKSPDFIRAFNQARRDLLQAAAGGFSTLETDQVLEDVANKSILSSFEAAEVVWPEICGVMSVNDFRQHKRYRLTVEGGYSKIGPDGELRHGSITDEKETLTAHTYGRLVRLTRQHMINDDLGAFLEIPRGLGRLAALRIEEEVFVTLLTNTGNFFHANNSNLQTGAGSDLTIAGLTLMEKTFSNFVDTAGLPILISPDRVLVGTQDYAVARQLFNSTELRPRGSTDDAGLPVQNPHAGNYRPIKSPYLNNTAVLRMDNGAAIGNQNENQWYGFADPNRIAALVVGFLNGRRTPILERQEAGFDVLGMEWRSYHDWGVAFGSEQGAVRMAGA